MNSLLPLLAAAAHAVAPARISLPASVRSAPALAASPAMFDGTRAEYRDFLGRLGFLDYTAEITRTLDAGGLAAPQREVLRFNRDRYKAAVAARELAAEIMAGLDEQRWSKAALENGTELAARLLALQPLDPPASLPPEVAKKDREKVAEWIGAVTAQKLAQQKLQVLSDVVKTARGARALKQELDVARLKPLSGMVETILLSAYTDAELGQTRYAGRALAASLVRFSRTQARPEVEKLLESKVRERGLRLENFVGDTLVLPAADGRTVRMKLETGDFLGERSRGREASEITFAVRPAWGRWWKAWREGLLGPTLGIWANPAKGRPAGVRKWLAERPWMQKGYSHVGMAKVDRADGVAMAWALDNYPNDGDGGVRKIGIVEQYAQNGPYLRLGAARLDAGKVWDEFQRQAGNNGWREHVYESGGFKWPSLLDKPAWERLRALPRSRADELLRELNERAAAVTELMITRYGVSFAYGFANDVWKAYCSFTVMIAHLMGGQFQVQSAADVWHPVVRMMKLLKIGDAKDQDMSERIYWPGSFFADPKVGSHQTVTYAPFREAGRLSNPFTIPAYVEMDPKLTVRLASALGTSHTDADLIQSAVRTHLESRASKRGGKGGYRSGASHPTGYSAGLEALLSDE